MVYFFTSNVVDPPATIYVGKDKFENEELIKYGWDCDIWTDRTRAKSERKNFNIKNPKTNQILKQFHADNLSSAHVYLRLDPDERGHREQGQTWTWDALPKELLEDCCQLTKANSIEGNKKDNVTIIYTPWSNLLKNAGMATGQVGFVDPRMTKKALIPTRLNPTINRLQKTRTIIPTTSSLASDKEAYLSRQRAKRKVENDRRRKEEDKVARERREEKERRERGYEDLMKVGEGGRSNEEGFDEEDFM